MSLSIDSKEQEVIVRGLHIMTQMKEAWPAAIPEPLRYLKTLKHKMETLGPGSTPIALQDSAPLNGISELGGAMEVLAIHRAVETLKALGQPVPGEEKLILYLVQYLSRLP